MQEKYTSQVAKYIFFVFSGNDTSSTPFQKKLNSSNAPVIDKKKLAPSMTGAVKLK